MTKKLARWQSLFQVLPAGMRPDPAGGFSAEYSPPALLGPPLYARHANASVPLGTIVARGRQLMQERKIFFRPSFSRRAQAETGCEPGWGKIRKTPCKFSRNMVYYISYETCLPLAGV